MRVPEPAAQLRRARGLLYAAAAAQTISGGLLAFAIPFHIKFNLKLGFVSLGLAACVQGTAYTLAALLSGRLADRFDRKRLALAGMLVFACAMSQLARTETLAQLLMLAVVAQSGLGCFWPALQANLGRLAPSGRLGRVTELYNVVWSVGMLLGGLAAAPLARSVGDLAACFWLVGLSSGTGAVLQFFGGWLGERAAASPMPAAEPAAPSGETPAPDAARREGFRRAALLANGFAVSSNSVLRYFVPEVLVALGVAAGLREHVAGALNSAMSGAYVLTFILLAVWRGWQYRTGPLLGAAGLLFLAALAMLAPGGLPFCYAAFILSGCAFAVTYSSSIFYSLDAPRLTGRRAGVHEACSTVGSAVTPLAGGGLTKVAGALAPLAPYLLLAVGTLGLLPVLARLLRRPAPATALPAADAVTLPGSALLEAAGPVARLAPVLVADGGDDPGPRPLRPPRPRRAA